MRALLRAERVPEEVADATCRLACSCTSCRRPACRPAACGGRSAPRRYSLASPPGRVIEPDADADQRGRRPARARGSRAPARRGAAAASEVLIRRCVRPGAVAQCSRIQEERPRGSSRPTRRAAGEAARRCPLQLEGSSSQPRRAAAPGRAGPSTGPPLRRRPCRPRPRRHEPRRSRPARASRARRVVRVAAERVEADLLALGVVGPARARRRCMASRGRSAPCRDDG